MTDQWSPRARGVVARGKVLPVVAVWRRSDEDRVVIVIGGSRGIGRETIDRLAGLVYAVGVNCVAEFRERECVLVDLTHRENQTLVCAR